MLRLISTPDLAHKFQVVRDDGLPDVQLTLFADDLLKSLKKNDRVVTIGGIIGTVANVTPDGKEVTLKVDDNTRLKMLRSSIQTVLRDDEPADTPAKT